MARWVEVGDGACLVVDTRGDGTQGAELAAAVREVTTAPWQVAITHAHFDHCFGTVAFLPAAVWAHRRCALAMERTGEQQRAHWVRHYTERGQGSVAQALAAAPLVPADRLLDDRADLDVGGRRVVLTHLGRGHTDHDVVAWLPDDGVLFAGDLVEHGAPPAFEDAFPLAWPDTVGAILDLGVTTVVPGHGDPVDPAFVQSQRDELSAVAALCRRAIAGEHADALLGDSPYDAATTRTALSRATA